MLNTTGDIITEVLVRNNRTTTDSFITDEMLLDWLRTAHTWAASYKPWTFTEGRMATTYTSTEEWFFEGYKADSIRYLQIGGKALRKIAFPDYQMFREVRPESTDRVFSDFGKTVFINPSVDLSGTLMAWGQYQPVLNYNDGADETIFTSYNAEGNEALVEKMTSYIKRREHVPQEAELHEQRAVAKLEEVWRRTQDEAHGYHTKDRGMFERIDVLDGSPWSDQITRDQF